MDVPDIMIIVQWGVTCSISTLWQRFGRCVRNPELAGIAILLAEKDQFDSERAKKAENAAKRRARAERKRQQARQVGDNAAQVEQSDGEERGEEEKRLKKPAPTNKNSKKTIDSVVDDLINAEHRGYACRRIPIMNAFENDKAGEFVSLVILNHKLNVFKYPYMMIATLRYLAVVSVAAQHHPSSVVISTTLQHFNTYMFRSQNPPASPLALPFPHMKVTQRMTFFVLILRPGVVRR
jgi:hypothetical protein